MTDRPTYTEQMVAARDRLVAASNDVLAGRLSIIEASRVMNGAMAALRLTLEDKDYRTILAIYSETDALPMGELLAYWLPSALEALQPEIDGAEAWARKFGLATCENLLRRFQAAGTP